MREFPVGFIWTRSVIMYLKKTFSVAAVFAALLTTAVFGQTETPDVKKTDPPLDIKVIRAGDKPLEAIQQTGQRNDERYKIGYEDVLNINVYRHPELSQTVSVGRDGTILLPRIDQPIVAICKTERELSSHITLLYRNYLQNPFVSARVVEQRSQPVAVVGTVTKPGSYFINRRVRLLELIAIAGGPDYERAGSRVQVARFGNVTGCEAEENSESDVQFFAYSLTDVLKGIANPMMEPGDIVSVLEAEEAYVIGDVTEPTVIMLKEPITLTQAIAKAGGIGNEAKTSKVLIQRREPGSRTRTELVFDLKEIRAQEIPDPFLQANDIVEVPTDTKKVIRNGILKALTSGLGNIFYRFPL